MDIPQLKAALDQLGVRSDAYDFIGGVRANETYVLREREGLWEVYYAERGLQSGLRCFASEEQACNHVLKRIERDPTTRRRTGAT